MTYEQRAKLIGFRLEIRNGIRTFIGPPVVARRIHEHRLTLWDRVRAFFHALGLALIAANVVLEAII